MGAWKEERKWLKDKIAEQEYLGELLNEKKSQIDFLKQVDEKNQKFSIMLTRNVSRQYQKWSNLFSNWK